jgi:hypothetical protein
MPLATHVPAASHVSVPSQNTPLSHSTPGVTSYRHEPPSHVSSVHGLPSSQSSGVVQSPVAAE